jgi:hypothetical protein
MTQQDHFTISGESLLTTIGNKHNTDKGTVYAEAHGYTEI